VGDVRVVGLGLGVQGHEEALDFGLHWRDDWVPLSRQLHTLMLSGKSLRAIEEAISIQRRLNSDGKTSKGCTRRLRSARIFSNGATLKSLILSPLVILFIEHALPCCVHHCSCFNGDILIPFGAVSEAISPRIPCIFPQNTQF
jgi:hypothetical protein